MSPPVAHQLAFVIATTAVDHVQHHIDVVANRSMQHCCFADGRFVAAAVVEVPLA